MYDLMSYDLYDLKLETSAFASPKISCQKYLRVESSQMRVELTRSIVRLQSRTDC
jgi:hypothetical protein